MSSEIDGSVMFILNGIKEDIYGLSVRSEKLLTETASLEQKFSNLLSQVNKLNKVLIDGNGITNSVVNQLNEVKKELDKMSSSQQNLAVSNEAHRKEMEQNIDRLEKDINDIRVLSVSAVQPGDIEEISKTPKEVKVEKFKFYAKVMAFMTAVALETAGLLHLMIGS